MKKIVSSTAFIAVFALYTLFRPGSGAAQVATTISPSTNTLQTTSSSQTQNAPAASTAPPPQNTPVSASSKTTTQTAAATPTRASVAPPAQQTRKGPYVDGTYTGSSVYVYYGYVQVQATIKDGAIADVQFLSHPNDRGYSIMVNNYAMPLLRQEALSTQNANVNTVSGATETSGGFQQSLSSALAKAA
ncbi:MAG: hypothetical protein B7X04_03180 [Parcubacteria group bacterium 21-54-25]|nr:MAG: hypothetical protein B7X04_03180 [Parcubacteria group bacterium 21-54-25]HQU07992.1 FMN-binding protein [Candidatus Paceibacterota bacterium]